MQNIESRDNPRFKSVISVRKGKEPDLIFVEGARLCDEALKSGIPVSQALFSQDLLDDESSADLVGRASAAADESVSFKTRLFRLLCDTKNPQGIAMICRRPSASLQTVADRISGGASAVPLAILLHEVNNPGNLGAVLRTAEAAGAAGVITSKHSVDAFSPAVLRGSMGASFRLPVIEKTDLAETILWAADQSLRIAVTDSRSGTDHTSADLTQPTLLIFGSEAHGLPADAMSSAALKLRIPLENGVESLNLAVSAGILLFEARRQKGY